MRRQQRGEGVRVGLAVAGGDGGKPAGAVVAEDAAQQEGEDVLEECPVVVPVRHMGQSGHSMIVCCVSL